ncbi:MAG TPA: hypothetical protein VL361_07025 [Candidatus Limnocylindrales bacterium]|jgi:hypothetical protein|nr:hypothetical protein [Candidatus Limnocylindrales bacterium]
MKSTPCESEVGQSFALQLIYPEQGGVLAQIAQTIDRCGGDLGHMNLLDPGARLTTRGICIRVRDERHLEKIVAAVRTLDKVKVVEISNPASPGLARTPKAARLKSPRVRGKLQKRTPVRR